MSSFDLAQIQYWHFDFFVLNDIFESVYQLIVLTIKLGASRLFVINHNRAKSTDIFLKIIFICALLVKFEFLKILVVIM
jgi:hypothetical protein